MRTHTILVFIAFLFFSRLTLNAQSVELGALYGFSGYMGDLQQSHIEVSELHKSYGIFSRINFNKFLSTRLSVAMAKISATDANYQTLEPRRMRNLSFESPLYEGSLQLELNFLRFGMCDNPLAKSYFFSGISGYYFNPQTQYKGQWIELQPLGTEGQLIAQNNDASYSLIQMAIPIGFGFRIFPAKFVSIGFELGFRKTFTDYLDDVGSVYPDLTVLSESNPLAAALSFRTPELGYESGLNPAGQARGANGNDTYFIGGVSLSIILSK